MVRKTIQRNKLEWIEKSWTKIIGISSGILVLFGAGYSSGVYKKEIECDLEQMKIRQELNEKLLRELSTCQNEKLSRYDTTVNDLKSFIELLIQNQNGTKK